MSTISLQADLSVIGMPKVEAALASLQAKFRALNRTAVGGSGVKERIANGRASIGSAEKKAAAIAIREENKRHAQALRNAEREAAARIRNEKRIAAAALKEGAKRNAANAKFQSGLVSGAASKAMGVVKGITASLVGGVTAIAATGIAESIKANSKATRVAIAASMGGDKRDMRDIRKDVIKNADKASSSYGISSEQAVGFMGGFQGLAGKLPTGEDSKKLMEQILPEALKSGTDLDTAGQLAGQFYKTFDKGDSKEAMEKTRQMMRHVNVSGAEGSIEMADFAANLPKLLATASFAGGDDMQNIKDLISIAQFSRVEGGGASSAAEAATSISAFGADMISKEKNFNKLGVKVKNDDGSLKSSADVILESIHGAAKGEKSGMSNISKISQLTGAEGIKAVKNPLKAYNDEVTKNMKAGMDTAKAQEAAYETVKKKLKSSSTVDTSQEKADKENEFLKESEQLSATLRDLQIAFAKDLVPVLINDLMPAFKELAPHLKSAVKLFSQIASWAGQNPLYAVGAAIAAAAVSSMAQAAIGSAISTAITSAIAGAGLAAVIGGAIAVAAAGAVGYAVGKIIAPFTVGKAFDATQKTDETITKTNAALGKGTSIEDKKKALNELIGIKSELNAGTVSEAVEYGAGMIAGDEEGVKKRQAERRANVDENITVLKDQITKAAIEEDQKRLTTPKTETTTESVGKVNELGNAAQEATTKLKALAGAATTAPASARPVK